MPSVEPVPVPCPRCHGRGWITDDVDCPKCEGTGKVRAPEVARDVVQGSEDRNRREDQ